MTPNGGSSFFCQPAGCTGATQQGMPNLSPAQGPLRYVSHAMPFCTDRPDERRPTCHRCEKGSHTCLGYDRPLIFVHQHPGETQSDGAPNHKVDADSWAVSAPLPSDVGHAGAVLDLHGFKDEIVISHLLSTFTIGLRGSLPRGTDVPTMVTILTGGGTSGAYLSGLGLAQAFFGHIHKVDSMVAESATAYGRALARLRRDLQLQGPAAQSRAYMNLWTSLFLALYEMVCSAGPSNWLQHSLGVSALVRHLPSSDAANGRRKWLDQRGSRADRPMPCWRSAAPSS